MFRELCFIYFMDIQFVTIISLDKQVQIWFDWLYTHHSVFTEISRCPVTADVCKKDDVMAQVSAVGKTTQGREQLPRQDHVNRACETTPCSWRELTNNCSGQSNDYHKFQRKDQQIIGITIIPTIKLKLKLSPLHATKALAGRGGIAPTHSRPRP
jgi:hypothetical protein